MVKFKSKSGRFKSSKSKLAVIRRRVRRQWRVYRVWRERCVMRPTVPPFVDSRTTKGDVNLSGVWDSVWCGMAQQALMVANLPSLRGELWVRACRQVWRAILVWCPALPGFSEPFSDRWGYWCCNTAQWSEWPELPKVVALRLHWDHLFLTHASWEYARRLVAESLPGVHLTCGVCGWSTPEGDMWSEKLCEYCQHKSRIVCDSTNSTPTLVFPEQSN